MPLVQRGIINMAGESFAVAPIVPAKVNGAGRALRLDMVAGTPGVSGPTQEDVAITAELMAQEQSEMIEGMVAGLAAKLEENPDNPEGRIMPVRSHAVLEAADKARAALADAMVHFVGNAEVLARLSVEAGVVLEE